MAIAPAEAVEVIRRETEAFEAAVRDADPAARVPSCPDWTVADLADHVRQVHEFWASQVLAADASARHERVAGASLLDVLAGADPGAPCWNWSRGNFTVRWVIRRMTQETAVHRWDAESAGAGSPAPVDTEVALDGIDEVFDVFLAWGPYDIGGGSWHLHATDSPHGEWLLRSVDGETLVGHGHEKADVATRGPASDLLLFLWNRVPIERLEVFGDTAIVDRFKALPLWD